VAVLLLGAGLALGVGAYLLWLRAGTPPTDPTPIAVPQLPEPPAVDLADTDPAIKKVVEEARRAVLTSPESGAAWGQLGLVLTAHALHVPARVCFARAEELDQREPRWPYFQGKALLAADRATALAKLERAADLFGDKPDVPRLQLAEALLEDGRLDEAERQFRRVLQADAKNARAHLGLGRLEHQRGDEEASLLDLTRSEFDPRTRKATLFLLAEVYQGLGKPEQAGEKARAASRLPADARWPDPLAEQIDRLRTGKQARLNQAGRLLNQDRPREAIALLRDVVHDYPNAAYAWLMLGQARARIHDDPEAEKALREAVRLAPDSVEGHLLLGTVLYARKDPPGALASFRRAVEIKPDNGQAHAMVGECLALQGDRPAAIEALRTAVRCKPQYAEAHRRLGELLSQEGRAAEALVALGHAASLNPQDDRTRELLEEARRQFGRQLALGLLPRGW
jgi:tetratricopeptide (TPR) repeat protein